MERRKGKARESSITKRTACFRKTTHQALEKAAGLYGYVRQPLCVTSSDACLAKLCRSYEAISPDLLAATCGNLSSDPTHPCAFIAQDSTCCKFCHVSSARFHQAKKLLTSQSNRAYSQKYPQLTDCWHIHIRHRGSSGLRHWTII